MVQNERGKFHSEGKWELLGFPRTDGYDALDWISEQPWSNGRVGTIGCSSSAEWQMALAAEDHPAHAAMVPAMTNASAIVMSKTGSTAHAGALFDRWPADAWPHPFRMLDIAPPPCPKSPAGLWRT